MAKFGFTEKQIKDWQDKPIFFEGQKGTAVIFFHGWTAMPKQIRALADFLTEKGYWVSIPLLSGHGTKPEDLEGVGWRDWLEDAKREIEKISKNPKIKKIVVGGASMGGNLALLASQQAKVDGIILVGTPVHLKNHFWVWLGSKIFPFFKKYFRKKYPSKVREEKEVLEVTSYQYFPVSSVKETLRLMRKSVFSLGKVTAPILIMQTNSDYLVAKYSPWIIYNGVGSEKKKLQWIKSKNNSHIMISEKTPDFLPSIERFLEEIELG
jgi:carboxylesterase